MDTLIHCSFQIVGMLLFFSGVLCVLEGIANTAKPNNPLIVTGILMFVEGIVTALHAIMPMIFVGLLLLVSTWFSRESFLPITKANPHVPSRSNTGTSWVLTFIWTTFVSVAQWGMALVLRPAYSYTRRRRSH